MRQITQQHKSNRITNTMAPKESAIRFSQRKSAASSSAFRCCNNRSGVNKFSLKSLVASCHFKTFSTQLAYSGDFPDCKNDCLNRA